MMKSIKIIKEDVFLGDIKCNSKIREAEGFSVVQDFVGMAGQQFHEPNVLHYGKRY